MSTVQCTCPCHQAPNHNWVAAAVWEKLDRQPGFREQMGRSRIDLDAGRWYSLDTETGVATPNPDWPDDGTRPDDWPEPHQIGGAA